MQRSKIMFIIILVLVFATAFTSAVYSDSKDGWKGYGLYNISNSKISVINEDVSIELQNDKVIFNGEFLIRNYTGNAVRTTLGIPAQGIVSITLAEKNTAVKWKKRSFGSLQNEFGIENRLPQENDWFVFNLALNPGETKILNMKLEAAASLDEQGSHTISYYSDRKLGFSNQVEKSSLYINILNFQPYNIIDLEGVDSSQVGIKGDLVLKGENPNTVSISYRDTTKAVLERLSTSAMYKPREIAIAFNRKDYHKASGLCDEYIKNPIDSKISAEDVRFIKAESLRRLQNYDKYLEIVEGLDYSKLNPMELKNKIYFDRINIYLEQQEEQKLLDVLKEMEKDAAQSTLILKNWAENSSTYAAAQLNTETVFEQVKQEEANEKQSKPVIWQYVDSIMEYEFTPAILFVTGLLLGFILRGAGMNRKRRKSRYIYRM